MARLHAAGAGRLLDNPQVHPLEGPDKHSIHCLVDVGVCWRSNYVILADPIAPGARYTPLYDLGVDGTALVKDAAQAARAAQYSDWRVTVSGFPDGQGNLRCVSLPGDSAGAELTTTDEPATDEPPVDPNRDLSTGDTWTAATLAEMTVAGDPSHCYIVLLQDGCGSPGGVYRISEFWCAVPPPGVQPGSSPAPAPDCTRSRSEAAGLAVCTHSFSLSAAPRPPRGQVHRALWRPDHPAAVRASG